MRASLTRKYVCNFIQSTGNYTKCTRQRTMYEFASVEKNRNRARSATAGILILHFRI